MGSPVPRSSLFNFEIEVHRLEALTVDGTLNGWSEGHRLPAVGLEESETYAEAWAGWSPEGLWFAVRVPRSKAPRVIPKRPEQGDCVELYVDTRDVRSAHRAGRYCHKFVLAPVGGPGRGTRPFFEHQPIHRALMDPPMGPAEMVDVASSVVADQYVIELHLPAAALSGFDVEISRRLGLAYIVHDIEHEPQNWPHPRVLPQGTDPSLWATIVLV